MYPPAGVMWCGGEGVAAHSERTYVFETLTADVSGKLFDFTQRRGLKVYQPGDLSSM
jgi:hypothetical protein